MRGEAEPQGELPSARGAVAEAPAASVLPFVFSGGFALLLFGVVTSAAFSVLGIALLALAIGGWIGELRNG